MAVASVLRCYPSWPSLCVAAGLAITLLTAWPAVTAQAQDHWAVGLKAGSLLGLGGITLERGTAGSAGLLNVGFAEGRQTLLILGRRYASAQPGNRAYLDVRLGALRVDSGATAEWVSLFGLGAGYELPMLGLVRLAIETGIGLQNIEPSFTPLTRAGVFIGGTIGVRF